ncbi:hypothetical protein L345_08690, partial [Ophiophagus hannah]
MLLRKSAELMAKTLSLSIRKVGSLVVRIPSTAEGRKRRKQKGKEGRKEGRREGGREGGRELGSYNHHL